MAHPVVFAAFVVGQCLLPKGKAEGWPITYKVTGVHRHYLDVKTQVEASENDALSPRQSWYRSRIKLPATNYLRVRCPTHVVTH